MRIHLSSSNRHIHTLCQDVFGDILEFGWSLHIATGAGMEVKADLYVWDVEPDAPPPPVVPAQERWRHFFLVDRADVQQFQASLPSQDANIVLKPITRAALLAFFTEACSRCATETAGICGTVESLQADRDEILQCLMQTNLKLQEYDQDRTNFLARAIHDFRAPLTAVTGYCGLLLSEDLGPLTDDQREVLGRMQRSAKKLSRMASAMFQLSIAPRVEVTLDLQKGEIRDCIEQALHEILPVAEEKRISIALDTAPSPEPLFFERMKLEQVLVNLLDNACRFAPRGGSIEIRGYPYRWDQDPLDGNGGWTVMFDRWRRGDLSANAYRVDIRDSGPGIPPTHLAKIFEEYTSYAGGSDRSGGGLGLAICRMILNQHKGTIWAESNEQGAVFSFVLPFHVNDGVALSQPVSSKTKHASCL